APPPNRSDFRPAPRPTPHLLRFASTRSSPLQNVIGTTLRLAFSTRTSPGFEGAPTASRSDCPSPAPDRRNAAHRRIRVLHPASIEPYQQRDDRAAGQQQFDGEVRARRPGERDQGFERGGCPCSLLQGYRFQEGRHEG